MFLCMVIFLEILVIFLLVTLSMVRSICINDEKK